MKKIIIINIFLLLFVNAQTNTDFIKYNLSIDSLNENYLKIENFKSINFTISFESDVIELGIPQIISSNNYLTDYKLNKGLLSIKSNIINNKDTLNQSKPYILIPLSIKSYYSESVLLSINDKVIEIRVSNGKIYINDSIPSNLKLKNNFPNPLKNKSLIRFDLPMSAIIDLIIYDLKGNRIRILELQNFMSAGFYNKQWDGKNDIGMKVSDGTYVCSLKVNESFHSMKMVLLR